MPTSTRTIAALSLAFLLGLGCSDEKDDAAVDDGEVSGADGADGGAALEEGMSVGDCTDRADNDGDGAFDCDDEGCAGSPDCTGAADADLDGVPAEEDCDDSDPSLGAQRLDGDCDGLMSADDCDDADSGSTSVAEDNDCDGAPTDLDCDDLDPEAGPIAEDGDCDGVLASRDCDDAASELGDRALDADCDGTPTEEDCDDAEPTLGSSLRDFDCDGAEWPYDCDDLDPDVGDRALDADCDGATLDEDCDDRDPRSTTVVDDLDCDAVLDADDCDDADPLIGATPDDLDCDGDLEPPWGGALVRISAGTFDMGCTPGQLTYPATAEAGSCRAGAAPVREVTLTNDYWMGTTEVTEAQFEAVMGYLGSPAARGGAAQAAACAAGDCPVTYVLWTEAAAFANAVSADAGLDACYTCIGTVYCALDGDPYACEGYRLPTEAEFEKAARCGADTLYAGSSDLSAVAWTKRSSSGGVGTLPAGVSLMPVAQRAANACGLFDLSGNAGEFSTDMWGPGRPDGRGAAEVDPYRASGPTGPAARGIYLTHGNSEPAARITASEATGYFAGNLSYTLGFRLVRSVPR